MVGGVIWEGGEVRKEERAGGEVGGGQRVGVEGRAKPPELEREQALREYCTLTQKLRIVHILHILRSQRIQKIKNRPTR